ncbi:MAG: hypothetical protein AB1774_11930 [Bacillota bacterium]
MRRKQIYLDEKSENLLKKWAALKGMSEASVVREALDTYLANLERGSRNEDPDNPLLRIIGMYKGPAPADGAINHDKYIYREDWGDEERGGE